ncbi:MAG: hypothetical protein M1836_007753 [Candelina mexicana]|nr:MAG: hypothetical protein M1836_007753 [Candelina mexicana]
MAVPWRSIFGSIAKGVARATNVFKRSANVAIGQSTSLVDQPGYATIAETIRSQTKHVFADLKQVQEDVKERRLEIVRRVPDPPVRELTVAVLNQGIQQQFEGYISNDNVFRIPGSFLPFTELPLPVQPAVVHIAPAIRDILVHDIAIRNGPGAREPQRLLEYPVERLFGELQVEEAQETFRSNDEEVIDEEDGEEEALGQASVAYEEDTILRNDDQETIPCRSGEEDPEENDPEEEGGEQATAENREFAMPLGKGEEDILHRDEGDDNEELHAKQETPEKQATAISNEDAVPGPEVDPWGPGGAEYMASHYVRSSTPHTWSDGGDSTHDPEVNPEVPVGAEHEASQFGSPPSSPPWIEEDGSQEVITEGDLTDPDVGFDDNESDGDSHRVSPTMPSSMSEDDSGSPRSPMRARSSSETLRVLPNQESLSESRLNHDVTTIRVTTPQQGPALDHGKLPEKLNKAAGLSFLDELYLAGDTFRVDGRSIEVESNASPSEIFNDWGETKGGSSDLKSPVIEEVKGIEYRGGNDSYSDERYAKQHPSSPQLMEVHKSTEFQQPEPKPTTPPLGDEDVHYIVEEPKPNAPSPEGLPPRDVLSNQDILSDAEMEAQMEAQMEKRRIELKLQYQATEAEIQRREAKLEAQILQERLLEANARRPPPGPETSFVQGEDFYNVTPGVTKRQPRAKLGKVVNKASSNQEGCGYTGPLPAIHRKLATTNVSDGLVDGIDPFPAPGVAAGKRPAGYSALDAQGSTSRFDLGLGAAEIIRAPPGLEHLAGKYDWSKADELLDSSLVRKGRIPVYTSNESDMGSSNAPLANQYPRVGPEISKEPKLTNGGIGRVGVLRDVDTNSATRQKAKVVADGKSQENVKLRNHQLRHAPKADNLRRFAPSISDAGTSMNYVPPPAPRLQKATLRRIGGISDLTVVAPPVCDFGTRRELPLSFSNSNAGPSFVAPPPTERFQSLNEVDVVGFAFPESGNEEHTVHEDNRHESSRANKMNALFEGIVAGNGCSFVKLARDAGVAVTKSEKARVERAHKRHPNTILRLGPDVELAERWPEEPSACPLRPRGLAKPVADRKYGKTRPWPRKLYTPLRTQSQNGLAVKQWRAENARAGVRIPSPFLVDFELSPVNGIVTHRVYDTGDHFWSGPKMISPGANAEKGPKYVSELNNNIVPHQGGWQSWTQMDEGLHERLENHSLESPLTTERLTNLDNASAALVGEHPNPWMSSEMWREAAEGVHIIFSNASPLHLAPVHLVQVDKLHGFLEKYSTDEVELNSSCPNGLELQHLWDITSSNLLPTNQMTW